MAIARGYLDRTDPPAPSHWKLPRAFWRETGEQLDTANGDQLVCGEEAIVEQRKTTYADPQVHRQRVRCIRPRGHEGYHASQTKPHRFNKSKWKALCWSGRQNVT
jgi:hypothetical protein